MWDILFPLYNSLVPLVNCGHIYALARQKTSLTVLKTTRYYCNRIFALKGKKPDCNALATSSELILLWGVIFRLFASRYLLIRSGKSTFLSARHASFKPITG